jgi:hypothetical protein
VPHRGGWKVRKKLLFKKENQTEKNKPLRNTVPAVYQSKGEQGLRDFVKKNKDKISSTFIADFAKYQPAYGEKT